MVGWLFALLSYHSWVLFSFAPVTYVLYLNTICGIFVAIPLDKHKNPCYDKRRGLDIPDVSPKGKPLSRCPGFEPLPGRCSFISGGRDVSSAGVAEWQTRQT